jgi:hypothetical protein
MQPRVVGRIGGRDDLAAEAAKLAQRESVAAVAITAAPNTEAA